MDNLLVDPAGRAPLDPTQSSAVGRHHPGQRVVWALSLLGSGLSRRYSAFAPGESSVFAMDFSFVLAPGAAIVSASLQVFPNTFEPGTPSGDWQVGDVMINGSMVYARLSGGVEGTDYQLRFTAVDSDGNIWPRTALCLCSQTS